MLPVIRHPRLFCLTANEKDFSLSLEMTMREGGTLPLIHFLYDPRRYFNFSMEIPRFFNESFSSSIQKPVIFIAVMPYSDYKHSKRSGDSGARKASMAGILSLCDFKGENNEKT